MLTLSTPGASHRDVPVKRSARPRRKRPSQYHHGDLRRALVEQALRTIQSFDKEMQGKQIDLSKTYTNEFVRKALAKVK